MTIWSRIRDMFGDERTGAMTSTPGVDRPLLQAALATPDSVQVGDAAAMDPVPAGIRAAAGWSWRLLFIAGLIYLLWFIVSRLSEVTIPLFVAMLLTAALWPLKTWLVRHHVPRGLAVLASLLTVVVIIFGILSLVGAQIVNQWDALSTEAVNSFNQFLNWLANSPLHVTDANIDVWIQAARSWANTSQSAITAYAASIGVSVGHFLAGTALAIFAFAYFLLDGPHLAHAVSGIIPERSRPRLMAAAENGWTAMVSYVRAAVTVAAVDGLGALVGAAAVGSSMWLAIGALTFLCAFVPLVGAIIAGVVATGVVLVTLGWVKAIIMLAVFVAVLELEGHVMQPFLLGKAVSIHPLAVLYGIAVGTIVAGIVGALFTVPLLAFGNAFVRALNAPEPLAVVPVEVPESPPPPDLFDEADSVLTASSPDEYVS